MEKRKKFSLTRMAYESTQSSASILSTEPDENTWSQSVELETSNEILVQLRELNKDVDSSFEFVCGVNDILCTTIPVNIGLFAFGVYAIVEITFGIKHLSDCPVEDHIPIFLFVGGCFILLKIIHMLYTNYRNRKHAMYVSESGHRNIQRTVEIVDGVLNLFLICWQVMGFYWTLRVWPPHFSPPLHEPTNWCHEGLYIFTMVQLIISGVVLVGRCLFQCALMLCYSCTNVFECQEM
ncbi:TBC1 domain family member 2b [Plakobranchus ocellatus]|uniref:TBC1 domain family member 2b n=1 Tax=Plakobranchus ocellatus TaxID=259542 RepID=A0AAV3X3P9_9GAST|nr:TBC1 domain family member 2b [Plakobranchus ocellatus]